MRVLLHLSVTANESDSKSFIVRLERYADVGMVENNVCNDFHFNGMNP